MHTAYSVYKLKKLKRRIWEIYTVYQKSSHFVIVYNFETAYKYSI